jgi:tRNA-(ms[2]io[6]A)-hydroxylase
MLGLKRSTDPEWARVAMRDLDRVLIDHAHCEMKAASNAMSLVMRHPKSPAFVLRLVEIAREELDHFARVVHKLQARNIELGAPPVDDYAADLRKRAAADPAAPGEPPRDPLLERLLVAALIEARSCERFKLLVGEMGPSHPMYAFYTELFEAEARHYRTFVDLAIAVVGDEPRVRARLERLAQIEAEVVAALGPPSPVVHG